MEETEFTRGLIEDLCGEIEDLLTRSKKKGGKKQECLAEVQEKLVSLTRAHRSFQVELKSVSMSDAAQLRALDIDYGNRIKKYTAEVKGAESDKERELLLAGAPKAFDPATATTQQVLQKTHQQYDEADESVQRGLQIISDIENTASATITTLKAQGEQLVRINENLDQLKDEMKRAEILLKAFGRRIATDKLIMFWLFLVVLGVVGIIVVNSVHSF
eukprot:c11909_g1_i1.p1 GENE.c11909_g1_i1~~c11909_g1_i1.p1  ORF type:complete len:217 (-),score=74.32 c11909_g1_i1:64-714(-)